MNTTAQNDTAMFRALLKFWRGKRGLSQLDLALTADVSARHVSFLETGRATPSREMVLTLSQALALSMREQNELLGAARFEPSYEAPDFSACLAGPVGHAIERIMEKQEPYPLVVMDRHYNVLKMNRAAQKILPSFIADASAMKPPLNVFRMLFDPKAARPFVCDWHETARQLLTALQREALLSPADEGLRTLLDELAAYPDVPADWKKPNLDAPSNATFAFAMERGDLRLAFFTTLTRFSAAGNVTLQEVRIEAYFPNDEVTEKYCQEMAS